METAKAVNTVEFEVIFDNGGGITLQIPSADYVHTYDSTSQAAEDVSELLKGSDPRDWEGNECDPDLWMYYDYQTEQNGGYKWLTQDEINDALIIPEDCGWANIDEFYLHLRSFMKNGRKATIAEKISHGFNDDGTEWEDHYGRDMKEACEAEHGKPAWRDTTRFIGNMLRYTFRDGSAITIQDGYAWDLGYADCFCWQGTGHNEETCYIAYDHRRMADNLAERIEVEYDNFYTTCMNALNSQSLENLSKQEWADHIEWVAEEYFGEND